MVGFMLYVCGRLDPTEFFYGMRLSFPEPPHLAQLKRSIERKVLADSGGRGGGAPGEFGSFPQSLGGPGSLAATYASDGLSAAAVGAPLLPDGSSYVVADMEILDFRLNEWVPLESRAQLYSGCQVAAIRDSVGSATAGTVDAVTGDALGRRALGLALEAESIFRAMDYDSRGAVTLSHLLRVLRHDVNYAVDLFSLIDCRGVGAATLQDFIAVFRTRPVGFWREVQQRLAHGGRADGVGPTARGGFGHEYHPHPASPRSDARYDSQAGPSPTASPAHRPTAAREPPVESMMMTAGRSGIAAELNAIMTSRQPAQTAPEPAPAPAVSGADVGGFPAKSLLSLAPGSSAGAAPAGSAGGVFATLTPDRRKQMLLGQALSPATPPPTGSQSAGATTTPSPGTGGAGAGAAKANAATGGGAPVGRLSARVTEALLSHLKRHQKGGPSSPSAAPPDTTAPLAPGAAERAAAKLQRAMLARKEARAAAAAAAATGAATLAHAGTGGV